MRFQMWMLAVVLVFALAASARPVEARQVVLHLKQGNAVTGELVSETSESVTVSIRGVAATYNRGEIEKIDYKKTVEEDYAERRATIAASDADALYRLLDWLRGQGGLELAKKELAEVAARFPQDDRFPALLKLVEEDIKARATAPPPVVRPAPTPRPTPAAEPPKPAPVTTAPAADTRPSAAANVRPEDLKDLPQTKLSDEQVNLLKVYLIEPRDRPRVRVPHEVLDEVFERYSDDDWVPKGRNERQAFKGRPDYQKLELLFRLKARDLYPKVTVFDDPKPIADFRASLHKTYVLNYCGTVQCHGGPAAGDFFLFALEPVNADTAVYTNFYILRKWKNAKAFMMDQSNPDRSLLVQYALRREDAATPHPDVIGWKPLLLRGTRDPRVKEVTDWIRAFGREQDVNWPIEYELPKVAKPAGSPTTQPTTAPAGG